MQSESDISQQETGNRWLAQMRAVQIGRLKRLHKSVEKIEERVKGSIVLGPEGMCERTVNKTQKEEHKKVLRRRSP